MDLTCSPCSLLPSPSPPPLQLGFLKEMSKPMCQSFTAEPNAGSGLCHPGSRVIWILSRSPAPRPPSTPRAVGHFSGSPPKWETNVGFADLPASLRRKRRMINSREGMQFLLPSCFLCSLPLPCRGLPCGTTARRCPGEKGYGGRRMSVKP